MKEILLIVILISFPFLGSSQIQLDHGHENEFGYYYYKNADQYKLFIDSIYTIDRYSLSESFIPFYAKRKRLFSKTKRVVIGTNNYFLNTTYKNIPVSLIPDVIKLTEWDYRFVRQGIVDNKTYKRIKKMDRKLFYTQFVYPGSNILVREMDIKTHNAVLFRFMEEGLVLSQTEYTGDIELPQEEYYWRSPYE